MIVAILPSVVRVIWSLEADMVGLFLKYLLLPKDSHRCFYSTVCIDLRSRLAVSPGQR